MSKSHESKADWNYYYINKTRLIQLVLRFKEELLNEESKKTTRKVKAGGGGQWKSHGLLKLLTLDLNAELKGELELDVEVSTRKVFLEEAVIQAACDFLSERIPVSTTNYIANGKVRFEDGSIVHIRHFFSLLVEGETRLEQLSNYEKATVLNWKGSVSSHSILLSTGKPSITTHTAIHQCLDFTPPGLNMDVLASVQRLEVNKVFLLPIVIKAPLSFK